MARHKIPDLHNLLHFRLGHAHVNEVILDLRYLVLFLSRHDVHRLGTHHPKNILAPMQNHPLRR